MGVGFADMLADFEFKRAFMFDGSDVPVACAADIGGVFGAREGGVCEGQSCEDG
jgi:hypothetical protein